MGSIKAKMHKVLNIVLYVDVRYIRNIKGGAHKGLVNVDLSVLAATDYV